MIRALNLSCSYLSMRTLISLSVVLFGFAALAQPFDALHPPDTYASPNNPYYWKNRPPHAGYWQQDVHYTITGRMDDQAETLAGDLALNYVNNSPDSLGFIYFHLYQEAFVEGSYLDRKESGLRRTTRDTVGYAGTRVSSISTDGTPLRQEQDNTVLKVWLNAPLAPGKSTEITIQFTTHWTSDVYRRMKLFKAWGSKHFDGVHWYPRIAVYDAKFGWDTQQHLGSEFYGDFGTFDVELDFPHHYIVDATGWLQNESEVLPPDLKAKLAITNFKDKPWNEAPSVIIQPEPDKRKVWKFHAENVHDFAFTADPNYRIGEAEWNGIKCVALVQEPHASGWQNAAAYTAKVIECFSRDFGMYGYPKMIVADARDGMEYPMLTLDSGNDPNYRGLIAHEVGHNWFFGMVGNNETYRAFLDEGFTQFLTSWGLEHIDGDTMVTDTPTTRYERRFTERPLAREQEVYYGYQRDAVRDQLRPINTHSDEFGHYGGGYGQVYSKTATMLYNLQYVLGDSLFLGAMQHYFNQWKFCHPYPEDMRKSFHEYTKADLNWFFDQWIETDKRIDYAVRGVKGKHKDSGQTIRIRRIGDLHMPIDLRVIARDGTEHDFHIPNTWFEKSTTATVLPRWIGYDDLERVHFAQVDIPSGIQNVIIDPTNRLADAYKVNDQLVPPIEITFDHHIGNRPDRKIYQAFVRPDLWWNGYDGVKVGVHLNSSYLKYKHRVHFSAWLNTGIGQYLPATNRSQMDTVPGNKDTGYDPASFNFRYENGTEKLLKGSSVFVYARMLDGLERYGGGFNWLLPNKRTEISAGLVYLLRRDSTDLTYLLYPDQWEVNKLNGYLEIGLKHRYEYGGSNGAIRIDLRNSAVGSASKYAQVKITATNENKLGKLKLHTRLFGQYGSGNTPRESALFLAGANPEEMMDNKYVRSVGIVPYDYLGYGSNVNNFQHGGGMNLRGYAGYLAPESDVNGNLIFTHRGNTGLSASGELDLDGLVRFRPGKLANYFHLDVYLFGDVGMMGYRANKNDNQRLFLADPRADAGVGAAFTIKKWGPLVDLKPLTIRFDMPLILSALPAAEKDNLAYRYVVAIGRSF